MSDDNELEANVPTRYIYGDYEDADLCFRRAEESAAVHVEPGLRLVHLKDGDRVYAESSLIERRWSTPICFRSRTYERQTLR